VRTADPKLVIVKPPKEVAAVDTDADADAAAVRSFPADKGPGWKHYSTTCIDPSNPSLLWTCQAYGNSTVDRQWCTAWAAFQLPEQQQPTTGETAAIITRPPEGQVAH
jgi:hypothetical protein